MSRLRQSVVSAIRRARDTGGMALIELLMVMVFLGVAFAVFATIFSTTISQDSQISDENLLQTELRAAVDGMAQELRQGYADDSTTAIASMSPTSITFYSPDKSQPTYFMRRISYQVVTHKLQRQFATATAAGGPPWTWGSTSAWATRFDSIQDFNIFSYLDANGNTASTPSAVRTIVITVLVQPKTGLGRQVTYKTSVTIRSTQT